jgi:uncharacterized protein (UPF0335 family)
MKTKNESAVIEDKVKDLETSLDKITSEKSNLVKDHDLIIRRKDLEVDVKVSEATKELNAKVQKLELENGNYKKETQILTDAFKNLGFDVKDMKEILNKLVDGIVSKNTIQLVK